MLVEYDQEKPARSVGRMTKTNASVETVLTELRTGIQRGRYAPGQRLITSELATNLKTSLAPVREALHILIGEGLVEMQPNRGASVRTLTAQTFIDGLQVLEVVGGLALRLIAPRLKDATVRRSIEHALEPVFEAGRRRNPHDFFTAIAASHRLVNDYSGNAYLNPILTRIHLEYFYRQMADLLPDDFWDRYTENYKITGGLLVRGDARGAERAWRQHVQWVIGLVRQHVN
jgi:DNA-binding GntR family transcriptional regulator